MIRLNNVHKYYFKGRQNELHVINDVSLELPETGMVAFFGRSGCGKTTLLNVIGGLDTFKSGQIEVQGQNINKKPDEIRNRHIGYIFQNYYLNQQVTVYENVAEALRLCGMSDEAVISERVEAALANVGMEKYIKRMPDTLSGGQKQRVAIARAIVKNPRIILADEPTGNLDEANTIKILDLLKSISKDHLVLIVTHEAQLVDYYCDRVIELSDGQVVGSHDNENADGYVVKDKNVIYLGDMEKQTTSIGPVKLECYGDTMPVNIGMRLVNKNGTIYLEVDNERVHILDASSEVVLKEGVFQREERKAEQENRVDMSRLPEVEGHSFGRLYHWKNALKEGFETVIANKKKSATAFRRALMVFGFVLTLMSAYFGINIKTVLDAKASFHPQEYYVYLDGQERADKLVKAWKDGTDGIGDVTFTTNYNAGDFDFSVSYGNFETLKLEQGFYDYGYVDTYYQVRGHGALLDIDALQNPHVLAGKVDEIKDKEAVVTSGFAEIILQNSMYSYLNKVPDLIGTSVSIFGNSDFTYRIAGIVSDDAAAVYLTKVGKADYFMGHFGHRVRVANAQETVEPGTILMNLVYDEDYEPETTYREGDSIRLGGLDLKIAKVRVLTHREAFLQGAIDGSLVVNEEDYKKMVEHPLDFADPFAEWPMTDCYASVYVTDAVAANAFLQNLVDGETNMNPTGYVMKTPDNMYDYAMENKWEGIINAAMLAVAMLVLMACCMYMIMRSSTAARQREIGIYRCIGVTNRNLRFRFGVEAFLLTTMSVFPGFVLAFAIIRLVMSRSGSMTFLFMPWWLGALVCAFLYIICVGCGVLPLVLITRKSPSQIMAKYDV